MSAKISARAIADHLARAKGYRNRATKCRSSAKETSSVSFGNCYRLLADHYVLLADLEEDYARRSTAMRQAANQAMLSTSFIQIARRTINVIYRHRPRSDAKLWRKRHKLFDGSSPTFGAVSPAAGHR